MFKSYWFEISFQLFRAIVAEITFNQICEATSPCEIIFPLKEV